MKLLLWILAPIASSLVFIVLTNLTLDKTVLSATYLQEKAREAQVFDVAAKVIPQQVLAAADVPVQDRAQIEQQLTSIIQSQDIETMVSDVLNQVEDVLHGVSSEVGLDAAPLLAELKNVGIEVPAQELTGMKLSVADYPQLQDGLGYSQTIKPYAYWGTAGLVVLIILLSFITKSFTSVIELFLVNAFAFAVLALVINRVPGLLEKQLHFTGPWEAFSPVVRNLLAAIGADLTRQFGLYAVVGAILGVGVWVASFMLRPKATSTETTKTA